MKKFFLVALMMATTSIVTAQTTNSRIAPANEVKPYKVKVLEKLGGMRHDEVTTVVGDSIYFDAETIEGFYFGVKGGVEGDFGRGHQTFGPAGALTVGYAGKRADLGAEFGIATLYNVVEQKQYYAPNFFVVGSLNFFTWGKDLMGRKTEEHRLQFYMKGGVQEAKVARGVDYSEGGVELQETGKSRAMGLAFGGGLRYEHRSFMSSHRWGIEVGAYMYDTKNSFDFILDDVKLVNKKDNPWRFCVEAKVVYKFVVHKHADNYSKKTKKWLSKY